MIRLALPKGRLMAGLVPLLGRVGLGITIPDPRGYHVACIDPRVDARLVKPRAVPQLVALGNFPLAFCGRDLVEDAAYDQTAILHDTGLNAVRIVVAVPAGSEGILSDPPRRPLVIASEYRRLAERWAFERGLSAIVIDTYGSTEGYAPDDADIVFDCVETGATMEANGLTVVERVIDSSTCLVGNEAKIEELGIRAFANRLVERLNQVRRNA